MAKDSWARLEQAEDVSPDLEHLRTSAMNNLGFLHYMGWGTAQDRAQAIELWRSAFARGHEEAAYHLCHTYGAEKEPEFDAKLAVGFCREALRRYAQLKEQDEGSEQVLSRVRWYLGRLQAQ